MRGPLIALLGLLLAAATLQGAVGDQPSEYECRPYIEKALKEGLSSLPASSPEDVGSSEQDADDLEMMKDEAAASDESEGGSVEEGSESTSVEEAGGEVSAEEVANEGEGGATGESTESSAEEVAADASAEGKATAETETLGDEAQVSAEAEAVENAAGEEGSSEEEVTESNASLESAEGKESVESAASEGESIEYTAQEEKLEEGTTEGGESVEEGTAEGGDSVEEGTAEGGDSVEEGISETAESVEEGTSETAESLEEGTSETAESLEEGTPETAESLEEGTPETAESVEEGTDETAESVEEGAAETAESVEEATSEGSESIEEGVSEGGQSVEEGEAAESVENVEEGEADAVSSEEASGEASSEVETSAGGESVEGVQGDQPAAESVESVEEGVADAGESAEGSGEAEEVGEGASVEDGAEGGVSVEVTTEGEASVESAEGEGSVESTEGGEASVESTGEAGVESTKGEESVESAEGVEEETASVEAAEGEKAPEQSASLEESGAEEGAEEVVSRKARSVEEGGASVAASSEEVTVEEPADEEAAEQVETVQEPAAVEETPEEELSYELEIPENLRPRDHIAQILRLDEESIEDDALVGKIVESTLKELKRLYDNAIKPLEILYKYRDLSNRHFGDPEIFSKPLILFMGPWSGGKSSIINYLLDNEYKRSSLRTGAEPSPAYFNILMWGEREEVLDGTQLAADWTFSGLQKFGQGLLDRLRGLRLNNRLLEKVNIVEIPGILEIRKQVERVFPFNDACQWFIDRADIIFLVYDPAKLDVGPETEAILDQLKGREYQTRIILNKADQVRPEELMRVQGTLIWNISPLMSSTQPPVMYSTSLWSMPYESGAPLRLLRAQERAFLRDMREAIDKRVENKIASARRFAVRVRNHAKMVDCYLTTYYNHKSLFGNRKKISDDIIEKPQDYHIYEGLSTLTNISRYDLPDPETYRDFFRVNPLYEFQQLAATCTYFKGCPINRLDVAIAYDLPELVNKYKKAVEAALTKTPST